jgi:hypothetical protein
MRGSEGWWLEGSWEGVWLWELGCGGIDVGGG